MLEDNTVVGKVRSNKPKLEMYLDFPRYVAFLNAGPSTGKHALGLLTSIRRHIESVVVPKLERFV
jgi:hypothetical protein